MNISFSATTKQAREHTKHCTRRIDKSLRLSKLKPGTILQGIEKGQGIKKGEHIVKLDKIFVLDVSRETLNEIIKRPSRTNTPISVRRQYLIPNGFGGLIPDLISETCLEGFPELTPGQFVDKFCKINPGCTPDTEITRILFDYVVD